jgi:peptidyl-prolyl cis-trans isomerase A (cyclophilin A)
VLSLLAAVFLAGCGGGSGSGAATSASTTATPAALLHPSALNKRAPQVFDLTFHTTKGDVVMTVHRSWAPRGADRLYNLARAHFFDGVEFFRVVPNFVVQFGISPDPAVSKAWRDATIPDDPVIRHNTRGTVSYAAAGPNTRTTQLFVNLGDNRSLDASGFAPVGSVTSGMNVVDKLYGGYGDAPTSHQSEMQTLGNAWLAENYPKLDRIESAEITKG